jgi:hypothetical protein
VAHEHARGRVASLAVVEDLEILEDRVGEFEAGAPALPAWQFGLHPVPERLHQGVVVAVAVAFRRDGRPPCPIRPDRPTCTGDRVRVQLVEVEVEVEVEVDVTLKRVLRVFVA